MSREIWCQENWDYIVARNERIDAWRKEQYAAREDAALLVQEGERARVAAWEADMGEARQRLASLAESLLDSADLFPAQARQLRCFIAAMDGKTKEQTEARDVSRELHRQWLKRARDLLRDHGADPEDMQKSYEAYLHTRPRVRSVRSIVMQLRRLFCRPVKRPNDQGDEL